MIEEADRDGDGEIGEEEFMTELYAVPVLPVVLVRDARAARDSSSTSSARLRKRLVLCSETAVTRVPSAYCNTRPQDKKS